MQLGAKPDNSDIFKANGSPLLRVILFAEFAKSLPGQVVLTMLNTEDLRIHHLKEELFCSPRFPECLTIFSG